mmetsp:Transcript_95629/g.270686  ORF Transcript_95629/g.270686 Transcript_95629/m.270686 type:complete len:192 (-) Transcript_95629:66-641(-)
MASAGQREPQSPGRGGAGQRAPSSPERTKSGGKTALATMPNEGDAGLFNDAHGFLENVVVEIEEMRRQSAKVDEEGRAEIQDLRNQLDRQKADRRDTLSRLRYEFEEFVHSKIDKVLEEVEEMRNMECADDTKQQAQIDKISEDVNRLKANLYYVWKGWGELVSKCMATEESNLRRVDELSNGISRGDSFS